MKNLLTLFLILFTALGFAQQPLVGSPKTYKVDPNSAKAPVIHRSSGSVARSSMACDTVEILDYNTYNELNATLIGINFNGSWNGTTPNPYANEIASRDSDLTDIDADNGDASFAMCVFDTLAFADYTQSSQYSMSLAGSQISFDSMGMFIGISGDTVAAHGTMANDSLVFRIFHVTGGVVSATPDTSIVLVGYAGLAPFLRGPNYLGYASIQVGRLFPQGQGFAVRMEYYRGDTSSHCLLSYSYADSCGTVSIAGSNYASPAYPSAFIGAGKYQGTPGSNFWGAIDSISPTVVRADLSSNANYFDLSSLGISKSCSFYYIQSWQMLPFVTITSSLGIGFASDTVLLPCDNSAYHTVPTVGTGDVAGATYAWSTGQSTANLSTTTPGVYTVTVTNPLNCSASASVTVMYPNGANVNAAFTAPDSLCVGAPAAFVNNSSDLTGYTPKWTFGQNNTTLNATNPTYTYTAAGTYPVTLTLDSAGCTFSTTETVTVTSVCVGIQNVTFENNISVSPNPSNGEINVVINGVDENVNITIYNIIGQTVKTYTSTDGASVFNKTMDLNNLSGGTYLMKIQSGNKIATKKLVITK